MKKLVLLLTLFAPALFAQTADVRLVALNVDRTTLTTGERFTVTMRWRNFGPDAAQGVVAEVGNGSGGFVVTGAGTSGWPCEPAFGGGSFTCRGAMPVDYEANMVVTMRAPTSGSAFALTGTVRSETNDPAPANNTQTINVTLVASSQQSSLSLSPTTQSQRTSAGLDASMPLTVANGGPQAAANLIVLIAAAPGSLVPIEASGAGWQCQHATHSAWVVSCLRPQLAAGENSRITVTTATPHTDGSYAFSARVSGERAFDPNPFDDVSTMTLVVGAAPETWTRILVPLVPAETPGANGSLWRSEVKMLTSGAMVEPQLGATGSHAGQFLYVREWEAGKVQLNARVWDVSRESETAGSEIPIAREPDFLSTPIELLGIPMAAHYRHTLRVYDLESRNGARVAIRVYANRETTPRANVVRTLTVASDAKAPNAQLPIEPAYLELDPAMLGSVADASTIRVEVEPLDAGERIWAFVSVTSNETHHVTTFSAQ
ncbi:MAG: DUF11 domain-containing protein [Acidobacteriota bacterium]|nr:DUF11 domain-containing protein [Acidobacteriota bacterium]